MLIKKWFVVLILGAAQFVMVLVNERTEGGGQIIPASSVEEIATEAGLTDEEASTLEDIYITSQLSSLRTAFFGLIVLALLSLLLSRGIPNEVPLPRPSAKHAESHG